MIYYNRESPLHAIDIHMKNGLLYVIVIVYISQMINVCCISSVIAAASGREW